MNEHAQTVSVEDAATMLGISRTLAYQCARKGDIAGVPVIRIGRRMLVLRAPLERLLSGDDDSQSRIPKFNAEQLR
jgi:hypothetical protein